MTISVLIINKRENSSNAYSIHCRWHALQALLTKDKHSFLLKIFCVNSVRFHQWHGADKKKRKEFVLVAASNRDDYFCPNSALGVTDTLHPDHFGQ